MKARLMPLYFQSGMDEKYEAQLERVGNLLDYVAEILEPVALGSSIPEQADAVLFPQLLGDAYDQLDDIKDLQLPLLIVTSEFGTLAMWDWEIMTFLRDEGIDVIAPYSLESTKKVCKGLRTRKQLSQSKFVVYQDKPGEGGQQDPIFKRFYWWTDRCVDTMEEKFGVNLDRRSFEKLGARAESIPDSEADSVIENWSIDTSGGLTDTALRNNVKLYMAVKEDIKDEDLPVEGVGINCLNESQYVDATPCLAWNMLYEEQGLLWACEADIMTLLTEYLVNKTLDEPVMMSNIYPFLMGQAALKHEGIPNFPAIVDNPDDHILLAHCGYLGVIPTSFATDWTLRPKVLDIVQENSCAIDGRFPTGDITLVKLNPTLSKIMAIEGELKGYVQYPGSDCRNGAVVEIDDGHELMKRAYSHHQILVPEHRSRDIELIGNVMDLEVEKL